MQGALVALMLIGIGAGLASCDKSENECLALPCPMPLAIQIGVTAADGGSVDGVIVAVSGAATGTASCSAGTTATTCYVPGVAGTYNLDIAASGFQATQRSVTVGGMTPECGCPTVVTVHLQVALSRNS
jgi:hypothetical protein